MKKIISVLMALAMVFSVCVLFSSCTKDPANNNESSTNDTESVSDANAANDNVLTMATNAEFPPYEYYESGKVVGIDAEIAQLIADDLGMSLEIVDIDFDSVIPGVQSGKYDMGMAGLTVDETRLKQVNFSTSYATGVQAIIVPEDSDIKSVDDLEGKKIGVQTSTTGDIYATDDFGEDAVTKYQNGAVAVQALIAGKVDCVIIDNEPAKSYVAANKGLKVLDTEYTVEDYAICFAKDNTELQEKVNASLEKLIANGEVQKIIDKYIPAE